MDLAELDLFLRVVIARGPQNDEKGIAVVLELRPLMRFPCILERQLVETERRAYVVQLLFTRLLQPDPGEAVVAAPAELRRLVDRDRALVLSLTAVS